MPDGAGRFAPSPSGELHLGNLRTALLAWLFARSTDRRFLMRVEDLDRVRPGAEAQQLADLTALGLNWDGDTAHQSERIPLYDNAIRTLDEAGRTYECFCTRKEIRQAASAPHAPQGAYPGTCRTLTDGERAEKRSTGRTPAIRLRAEVTEFTVTDTVLGDYTGPVDDLVLRRGDGIPAYNLAVVVDDGAQGIDQVVRGDDLLSSSPRQAYLATLLGVRVPEYVHVPLALNVDGKRLAKRDGAVTLGDLVEQGRTPTDVFRTIAASLGLDGDTPEQLLAAFDPATLPREPWIVR